MTAPIETSATTGAPSDDGIAIASGFVPASGSPPPGDAQAARRGRREQRDEARRAASAPHPVAERAGRERARADDEPRALGGGSASWARDDRGERQVAERAVAVPALVARLRDDPCAGAPRPVQRRPASRATRCARARARAARAPPRRGSARRASRRRPRRSRARRAAGRASSGRKVDHRPAALGGDAAQLAVRVRGDGMPDGLEERHVAVGVRVRGRRGEVEALGGRRARAARLALPSPCAARSERPV